MLLRFLPPFLQLLSSAVLYSSPASASGFNVSTHGQASNMMNIGVETVGNALYLVNITLGGQEITVGLDTGSTDLWIDPTGLNIQYTNTTDLTATEIYGKGMVVGPIAFAELKVGDFVLPSQAFVNATQISDLPGMRGILGMGFDTKLLGNIYQTIRTAWGSDAAEQLGHSFLTHLFELQMSLPNNFDVQLGRTEVLGVPDIGTFIIGGHDAGYDDVEEAPKLKRVQEDHWSVIVDEMRVNSQPVTFVNRSSVMDVPQGKLVAALDTGFTIPSLPRYLVDAVYSSVEGATFYPLFGAWIVPCGSVIDLSFVIGGREYSVHPIDLAPPAQLPIIENGTSKNVTICIASYQYLTLDPTAFAGFDMILGDAFLRSVYASFDYGDYHPTNHTTGEPFVQLLSVVDAHSAVDEFHEDLAVVLAAFPPTIEPADFANAQIDPAFLATLGLAVPASSGNSTAGSVSGALAEDDSTPSATSSWAGLSRKWGIVALALLGANLLVGLILLAVVSTMCVRGMKGRATRAVSARYEPVRLKEATDHDAEAGPLHGYHD